MPRNASGVYSKPVGTTAVSGQTISSSDYNSLMDDIVDDLNEERPITAGGTGGASLTAARSNLGISFYTSKSAAQSANVDTGIDVVQIIETNVIQEYQRDASGTDLTTGDGATWTRVSALNKFNSYAFQPNVSGYYYAVDYSSDRTNQNIYAYTANVKRTGTGGASRPVAAQLNAYDLSTAGTPNTVFGIACEAWSGDATTEAAVSVGLKGIEPAVISQRHDNDDILWGMDVVFKNRRDGGTLLHGSAGTNQYNKNSVGINISAQARSADGEYCGWQKGIRFASASLDISADGPAIGIDFVDAPSPRMSHAMLLAETQAIGFSGDVTSTDIAMRYVDSTGELQVRNNTTVPVSFLVSGGTAGIAVNSTKVVGAQTSAISNSAGGDEPEKINAILASMRAHGLIAT